MNAKESPSSPLAAYAIMFFSAAIIALLIFSQPFAAPPKVLLQTQILRDLANLYQLKKLPDGFNHIGEIKMIPTDPLTENVASTLSFKSVLGDLKTGEKAKFRLDILMTGWEENSELGAMVFYTLVDLKSGNTTWELGRTFNTPFNIWIFLKGNDQKTAQVHPN